MKKFKFNMRPKGELQLTNTLWILVVIAVIFFGYEYYHDHHDTVVIHAPEIHTN